MKKLNSGTRPFATKIVTSLRNGNIEYERAFEIWEEERIKDLFGSDEE